MGNLLIRGIPKSVSNWVRKFAASRNLSMNEAYIQLISTKLNRIDEETKEAERFFEGNW